MIATRTDFPFKVRVVESMPILLPDGTILSAKAWLPETDTPVPAVLEYLPYRKREGTRARDQGTFGYLAGYGYAHLLTRFAPGRPSVLIHIAVMIAASLTLPLSIAAGWGRPPEVGEAFWLLGLFAVSIGLPFFALAANSPLLQAWFARTNHPAAKDPYFLYAASNLGSFAALIAYPFVIEPFLTLREQAELWAAVLRAGPDADAENPRTPSDRAAPRGRTPRVSLAGTRPMASRRSPR